MKSHLILGAVAATLLLSGAAYASGPTNVDKCTTLTKQWNDVSPTHKTNAKFAAAQKDANAGIQMCHAKKESEGILSIDKALNMLGVKPAV